MRRWRWLWCSVLSVVGAGCATGPTQLIVVVDTDLEIPARLDLVRVTVTADGDRMASDEQALTSADLLPLTVSLVPEDGSLGPIDVLAEGYRRGAQVVRRRARVMLVRDETRVLRLHLVAECVGIDCGADRSCGENGCVDIVVAELPPWTGTPPRLGEMDAGVARDGAVLDASLDGATPLDAAIGCELDADCDDAIPCTADRCEGGFCVREPDDDACDDGNPCTDDRCEVAIGCTEEPNDGPCDDGTFCNGFDTCAGGTCSMHGGDPCAAPTVCDEAGTRCTGCMTGADCPDPSSGAWGGCGYSTACAEAGTRTRTNRTYACTAGSCVPSDVPESEACNRTTAGDSCGVGSCDGYGPCDYADACDESASRSRTCTDLACAGGVCRSSSRTETDPCSRSTSGDSCGATDCTGYGSCDYSDGCDEDANRSRTCMDFACASGSCQSTPRTETMACNRSTTGDDCGSESCGMYGGCDYSTTCDEDASNSRTCTQPICAGGSCSDTSTRNDSMPCSRDTDGTSCGAGFVCTAASCVSCTPTLSGAHGAIGSTYMTEVTSSGSTLTFYDSTPASGNIDAPMSVTFSGSVFTGSCIWQVFASGSTMTFTDFGGFAVGSINVSGATVSGSGDPPCSPSPYGCFPPCLSRVVGSPGALELYYSDGSSGSIAFDCP